MDEAEKIKLEKMKRLIKAQKKEGNPRIDRPIVINDSDFDSTVQRYPLVLVDFWAPWCHPCKIIAPSIEALAKENAGKLVCAKVNIDENPQIVMRFQTISIPTLILFKNGEPVDRITGAVPKSYLEERINAFLY